jgi:hypothetical protein
VEVPGRLPRTTLPAAVGTRGGATAPVVERCAVVPAERAEVVAAAAAEDAGLVASAALASVPTVAAIPLTENDVVHVAVGDEEIGSKAIPVSAWVRQ